MELPLWKAMLGKTKSTEDSITDFLKSTELFSNMNKKAIRVISGLVHLRNFSAGESVFRQGEAGAGFYIIMDGKVKITASREHLTVRLAELGPGAFFGELSLFTEDPRSATATCIEESRLLGFFQPDLKTLIQKKPKIGVEILNQLASVISQRLNKTNALLEKNYFKKKLLKHEL